MRRFALIGGDSSVESALREALRDLPSALIVLADTVALSAVLNREQVDALFFATDWRTASASRLVNEVRDQCSDLPLILLAHDQDFASALKHIRSSRCDVLRVPFTPQEAQLCARKALLEADHAEEQPAASDTGINMDTESSSMKQALALADRAARSSTTVLIRGESGVGKEVFAQRIHDRSARASQPFVKVHCAALPEAILESELFGYEKGAFTGAAARKAGRFELAAGGTIFLDEIGDISPAVQVKLLRVLQDRKFERLGGTQTLKADVRVIAATHRQLERMLKTREFREDLYYRLNVLPIEVPPLRTRPDHVAALARHFCRHFAEGMGRSVTLDQSALAALTQAAWPGNVRQLQNMIERLVVLTEEEVISSEMVTTELSRGTSAGEEASAELSAIELSRVVQKAERKALQRALERTAGNRVLAARLLGISKRTLFYKLREHKMT